MKTVGIKGWNALFCRTSRSFISRNCSSETYSKRDEENKVEKDLNNFLVESPLRHFKEHSQWITSPYAEGSLVKSVSKNTERKSDPQNKNILMFPGQGSQFVGMGKGLFKFPNVQEMFEAASAILGYNLKKLCLKGPLEKLNKTEHCQPATVVCSLAALEKLKHEEPLAFENCVSACGFSLGEISALIFAGSLSFEDGIRITKVRAKAMQACSEAVAGGMMTILYGSDSDLKSALIDAKEHCLKIGINNALCEVANYISPEIKVIAGHEEALKYIEDSKKKYKIRKTSKLLVSGAFHTKLMLDAVEPIKTVINNIKISDPLIPVLSTIHGKPYKNAKNIRQKFPEQVYMPVKWEQVINCVYRRPKGTEYPKTFICGPGFSLLTIMKRMNAKAANKSQVVF